MKKLVMTQSVCQEGLDLLKGKAEIYVADNPDPNNYIEEMKNADGIIVRIGKMDRKIIEQCPNLKAIGRTGVGYDSVDIEAATEYGIPVVITPGANTHSVAEHALALIMALSKNIVETHNETKKGNFTSARGGNKIFEVAEKKVGIIGFGNIGKDTAKLCAAVGMKVSAYDPVVPREVIEEAGYEYYDDYKKLLADADIISLHVPLLPSTKNMITLNEMKSMKKTAVLINCSRGGLINEEDLIYALNNDIIAGAATDVFETEPPKENDPLLNAKNIIYTPHTAAQTREAVMKMATMCVNGCLKIMNGEKVDNVVNKEAYNHPRWKK